MWKKGDDLYYSTEYSIEECIQKMDRRDKNDLYEYSWEKQEDGYLLILKQCRLAFGVWKRGWYIYDYRPMFSVSFQCAGDHTIIRIIFQGNQSVFGLSNSLSLLRKDKFNISQYALDEFWNCKLNVEAAVKDSESGEPAPVSGGLKDRREERSMYLRTYYIVVIGIVVMFAVVMGLMHLLEKRGENHRKNMDYAEMLADLYENDAYHEIVEGCDQIDYGYYDVDRDGTEELILTSVRGITIFSYQDGECREICREPYSILLENGLVWYHRPGAAPMHDDYQVFVLEGAEYQRMCSFARYDWDQDGAYAENGNGDTYCYNEEEIAKQEWDALIQPYMDVGEAVLRDAGTIAAPDK